jgi:medium-chain acyl-[acyl-carrier-protein] hydrolase
VRTGTDFLVRPRPLQPPRMRLFCLAHAGGGASMFVRWAHELADGIEICAVQLPGRETRLREPGITRMASLTARLAVELTPWLDVTFAIFGHSMGCLAGFELARELRRRGLPQPGALFLSGHRAPASPNSLGQFSELPDDEFIAQIGARYGGIPPAVLADRDLLQHYLPALRADFELLGTYEYTHEAPLDCPFYAYNGLADTRVTAADLDEWRTLTTGPFQRRWFPGGHFYLQKERSAVLRCLASDLARE